MPVTALKVPRPMGGVIRSKVITTATEHGLLVELFRCDEEWMTVGQPEKYGETVPEDEYHIALRQNAHAVGHYVPEHSTDPEWNPKTEEDVKEEQ